VLPLLPASHPQLRRVRRQPPRLLLLGVRLVLPLQLQQPWQQQGQLLLNIPVQAHLHSLRKCLVLQPCSSKQRQQQHQHQGC
jgi:hypothetical protein